MTRKRKTIRGKWVSMTCDECGMTHREWLSGEERAEMEREERSEKRHLLARRRLEKRLFDEQSARQRIVSRQAEEAARLCREEGMKHDPQMRLDLALSRSFPPKVIK